MNIRETLHPAQTGLIVSSLIEGSVTSLTKKYLFDRLSEHGFLVLRGFRHSIEDFSRLVRQTSGRISLDPARSFDGDTAQKVDAGYDAVGLHCENGNSPFWPDLCWFYCQKAPAQGSQTTVCDGKQVFKQLSHEARAAFTAQNIVYSRRVEENKWKTYAFHALASQSHAPTSVEETTLEDLISLTANTPGAKITLNGDSSICYEFHTPAIRTSHINHQETQNFANSIFGPSNNYEKPVITFESGKAIPAQLLAEVEKICDDLTHDISWHHGDIVLIDNTRVMHGRRRIEDKTRTIFNALSYID